MGEENQVVGIAEYAVAVPPQRLAALGLGSCVAVVLYDPDAQVGGLAHVMLPSSRLHSEVKVPGKFADTALDALVAGMEKAGGRRRFLRAKIIGGANMFPTVATSPVPIGLRNVNAARLKLQELGVPVVAEEVGGTQGRTLVFYVEDGRVEIRTLNQNTRSI